MKFTTALITAAHAFIKSGKAATWKEAINLAIKETKAGVIQTITFLKKSGEQTTRIAYLRLSNFINITGTGKSHSHLLKFVDLQAVNKGLYPVRSAIKANILK